MDKNEKSKMVGLRLPLELYDKAKKIATNRGDNLANLIKKSLNFIISEPEKFADFEKTKKDIRSGIYDNPLESFKKIKYFGFSNQEELTWITELMQSAWSRYSDNPATVECVVNTVKIFEIIINLIDSNIKSEKDKEILFNYSISTFPEKAGNLKLSINESFKYLNSKKIVSGTYADYVARCLSVILRNIPFKINPNELSTIYNKMTPWAFLVATRGLVNYYGDKVNTASLRGNRPYYPTYRAIPLIKNGNISITTMLTQFNENGERKNGFSGAISFKDNGVVLTLNLKSLYELYQSIQLLEDEKPEVFKSNMDSGQSGEWTLYKWYNNNPCIIMKPGIAINLLKKNFDDFIKSVKDLYANKDVQDDLLHEYFEIYGII